MTYPGLSRNLHRVLPTLFVAFGAASCQLVTELDESRLNPQPSSDSNTVVDGGRDVADDATSQTSLDASSADVGSPADGAPEDATVAAPDAMVPKDAAMVPTECDRDLDCPATSGPCRRVSCETGRCITSNEPDGQSCTTNKCWIGQSCNAGTCTGGTERDCRRYDTECSAGVCEETTGECVQEDLPKGTACDSKFCKLAETCDGHGKCSGGTDRTCAGAACEVLQCSESESACVVKERGCAIDGICIEEGKKNPDNDCQTCQPSSSAVAWTPRPDGEGCNDGLKCTNAEMCQGGVCMGRDRCDDDEFCSSERNRCIDRDDH